MVFQDETRTPTEATAHSIEAEQAVLGAVLMNNDAFGVIAGRITAEDFYEPVHQSLWEICSDLINRGRPANPITVRTFIPDGLQIDPNTTIKQYVARLAAAATTIINAPDYAQTIRDMADRRRLASVGEELLVRRDPLGVERLAAEAIARLDAVIVARTRHHTPQVNMSQAVGRALDAASEAYQRGGEISGITWGLRALDRKTLGLQRGELIVAAGRPGMGKSALGCSVARRSAEKGTRVLMISLEMGDISLTHRMLTDELFDRHGPLAYSLLRSGKFQAVDYERLADAGERLKLLPITIEQRPGLTVGQITALTRQHQRKHGLDLLVVDHMHLVRPSERYAGNRVAEVGEISGALKATAKDLGIAVLALCQLSRGVEQREDKRPTLSDLRWSGEIEQDADLIIMLHRQAYYLQRLLTSGSAEEQAEALTKLEKCSNVLEAIVEKARNGPTGIVHLFCDIGANVVRDLEEGRTSAETNMGPVPESFI